MTQTLRSLRKYVDRLDLEYIHQECFETAKETGLINDICSRLDRKHIKWDTNKQEHLAGTNIRISREGVFHLFRKMNFAMYFANRLRDKINATSPRKHLKRYLLAVCRWYDRAVLVRNQLVLANYRLLVLTISKYIPALADREDAVAAHVHTLIRAIRMFDFTRGLAFSTYLVTACRNNYVSAAMKTAKVADLGIHGHPELQDLPECGVQQDDSEAAFREYVSRRCIGSLTESATTRLAYYFGLKDSVSKTYESIAQSRGTSRQAVQQDIRKSLIRMREDLPNFLSSADVAVLQDMGYRTDSIMESGGVDECC